MTARIDLAPIRKFGRNGRFSLSDCFVRPFVSVRFVAFMVVDSTWSQIALRLRIGESIFIAPPFMISRLRPEPFSSSPIRHQESAG
jgi:hypothetical protein